MKRNRITIYFALFALLLAGCKSNDSNTMTFRIEGTLDNASGKTLYIEEMTPDNGPQFLDSIKCDEKGNFSYKGSMDYQTFFNLHSNAYDYIVLLPNDGDKIKLTGDADNLGKSYRVNGSGESQLMWQIQSYINDADITIADIAQQDKQNRETLNDDDYEVAHARTDSIFIAEREMIYMMFSNFIADNRGSLATLYAIDAPFNHTMRVFYAESDFEMFEEVLDGLLEKSADNPHTQYYRTRVERARSQRLLMQQQQQSGQEIIIE